MLPIVDFSQFRNGCAADRDRVAAEIADACSKIGFLYVQNHGVDLELVDRAQAAQRAYFALPEAEKRQCERASGRYRGYIPPQAFSTPEGRKPILYEGFIVGIDVEHSDEACGASEGMVWPTPWPLQPDGFAQTFRDYFDAVTALSNDLFTAYAMALGLAPTAITEKFKDPMSNMAILHYLAREREEGDDNVKPHKDTNALTILLPDEIGGLEILMADGSYLPAPHVPGAFVVNTGNMMETWSGGQYRSTFHRVHPPVGRDRYSLAYFASPNFDTNVEPLLPAADDVDPAALKPLHAGDAMKHFVSYYDA